MCLLDDDDPILLGFLGMWTALAVLFVAVVLAQIAVVPVVSVVSVSIRIFLFSDPVYRFNTKDSIAKIGWHRFLLSLRKFTDYFSWPESAADGCLT